MSKKSSSNLYMKVIDAAFVTISNRKREPNGGKFLVKVDNDGKQELIGLQVTDLRAVNSLISTLERIRAELVGTQNLHPALKAPTSGDTH